MTIFLVFVCAMVMVCALVIWGVSITLLRLAPIVVRVYRRKTQYEALERQLKEHDASIHRLRDEVKKLNEDAINDALAARGGRR